MNSAFHQGQCGKMTRIVVGCDKHVDTGAMRTHQGGAADELVSKNKLIRSTFPNLNVHFAPSIPEAKEFPWYNKPWSFHHWVMKNPPKETAICILGRCRIFWAGAARVPGQGGGKGHSQTDL